MNNTSTTKRRSLKGTLRTILLKCRWQSQDSTTSSVGSGLLRKDPSLQILPNDSTTAFLLGLESVPIVDEEADSNDIPDRFDISSLATSAAMSSTRTLMPKMSLSHFQTYHPPIQETKYLHRGRCDSVSSSLVEGASHQASLYSLKSFRSTSTLRIQRSSQTLRSESDRSSASSLHDGNLNTFDSMPQPSTTFHCPSPPRTDHSISPRRNPLRKRASFGTVSSPSPLRQAVHPTFDLNPIDHGYPMPYDYSRRFSRPLSVIEEVASSVDEAPNLCRSPAPSVREAHRVSTPQSLRTSLHATPIKSQTNPLLSVKNFSSFCAIDTVNPGCPVTATSKDLKYIFEVGENYCLNTNGTEGVSMDVITGSDTEGNPVTHLVIFSPLIIPHSGRSRFMLASLVDITEFLADTASLPELEMISEESTESDPPTPVCRSQPFPKTPKYQLSVESLLGGCFVDDPHTPVQRYDEDVWINLATEERKQYSQQTRISSGSRTPVSATGTLSSANDVLDDFMCKMQELHADFFLLAKSPLDDNYYEICNVSPRVYDDRDYVNGHLSKTSASDMSKLSSYLTGDDSFDMEVRWGSQGVLKHLYCVPLFARSAATWICFLVNPELPVLW